MLGLRPFRSSDAKEIIKWQQDEESFYKWSAGILGNYPVTEERMLEATSGRLFNDKYFPFVAFDETGPVGFFTFRVVGENNDILRFGYVIVDPSKRGKGYGKEMLKLGIKFALEVYCGAKVALGVFDNNPGAYYCYKSVGFVETGDIEEYELMGKKWKCIEMEYRK